MATGIISTLFTTETKGKTLEDLSNEDQMTFVRGIAEPTVMTEGSTAVLWTPQHLTNAFRGRTPQDEQIPMGEAMVYGRA